MPRRKILFTPRLLRRAFLAVPAALLLASCATPTASTSLDAAIAAPYRGDKAQARDVYRHPKDTLEFFGLAPTQSVLEIAPGGGWYTDILAPYLRGHGTLYEAQYLPPQGALPEGEAKGNAAFERKLAAKPDIYGMGVVCNFQAGRFIGFARS